MATLGDEAADEPVLLRRPPEPLHAPALLRLGARGASTLGAARLATGRHACWFAIARLLAAAVVDVHVARVLEPLPTIAHGVIGAAWQHRRDLPPAAAKLDHANTNYPILSRRPLLALKRIAIAYGLGWSQIAVRTGGVWISSEHHLVLGHTRAADLSDALLLVIRQRQRVRPFERLLDVGRHARGARRGSVIARRAHLGRRRERVHILEKGRTVLQRNDARESKVGARLTGEGVSVRVKRWWMQLHRWTLCSMLQLRQLRQLW
mmetsp:Transcript_31497/g.67731  ORF Transcript_31497/g.67731 Transcript_31497/m.67731 type:complete len:264 (-) Transcript_31497:758-1549(-)